ncbi:MAG: transcriptional repressor NrdR [Actinobacteria bacterium]|jgi:transcriptional repressor NrdR|nr:transcriptional repressor NrdR [Actinomycetota bacterium]MBE3115325.1 transcriptional repressor NrdR [Actinomycetota bacterium]MBU4313969.1 transcriptional regulator NrdR [Actinomycetota bacterium]MBU4482867.1 transcriptional regulator NrdR [Actinomycetota bacterium]MCJ7727174.1 transcriptional regulator NrdR [Actinomycetota bacterium]
MKCPYCSNPDTRVIDSRLTDSNDSVRRRRMCEKCSKRFTTYERMENQPIAVIKKDNTRQPFDRNKILSGLIRACIKRNISTEVLNKIVDDIENEISNMPSNEIQSKEIGNLVLKRLKNLDKVAYIRFASVYKQFDSIKQFTKELSELQKSK